MLRRILTKQSTSIASAAIIVASFSIISRFIGFIRDRILAGAFGAGDELDIYFAAFRLPDLFYQLAVVGALSASFIPLFTKYYSEKQLDRAWRFTSNVLTLMTAGFGALVLFGIVIAPLFASVIAPGFAPEKQIAVAHLAQWMLIAQVFLMMSMVFGSVLQGAKHFMLYSLAPIFYNVGIIIGAIVFVPHVGLTGLAWGVILGALMHFMLQAVGVFSLGYTYRPVFQLKHPDVRYMLKHMPPRVMGLAVSQLNFVAMTVIASLLAAGSVTMLQFAYNLNYFPIGVVAVSYAIAAFPTLCEQFHANQKKRFVETFSTTVRQMMLFIIPLTVLFILLRAQIVRLVLGAGAFTWEATILTADTLGWFALSFLAQAFVFILIRAFFAQDDTVTPFLVGIVSAGVNIIAALLLTRTFGVVGLGMAFSASAILQCILLWIPLRRKLGSLDERIILHSFGILSLAAAASAIVTQGMKSVVVAFVSLDTFFGVLAQCVIAGGLGFFAFIVAAYILKSQELYEFMRGVKRRLIRKAEPEEPMVTNLTG